MRQVAGADFVDPVVQPVSLALGEQVGEVRTCSVACFNSRQQSSTSCSRAVRPGLR
ncbi:hypothetical protein [Nonomuraea fuscirosea]|uniref:hypothetical protein n=1 Tax=Nonomuraea fuscirosea TaxID=1291556 RepID=UPI0033C4C142